MTVRDCLNSQPLAAVGSAAVTLMLASGDPRRAPMGK